MHRCGAPRVSFTGVPNAAILRPLCVPETVNIIDIVRRGRDARPTTVRVFCRAEAAFIARAPRPPPRKRADAQGASRRAVRLIRYRVAACACRSRTRVSDKKELAVVFIFITASHRDNVRRF